MQLKCIVFGEEVTIDDFPDVPIGRGAPLPENIDEIIRGMPWIEDCSGIPSTDMKDIKDRKDFERALDALVCGP